MDMTVIGLNIKRFREQAGLSQSGLGSKVHVAQQQIARYELGQSVPSFEMLKRIAEVFGVSLYDLASEPEKMVYVPIDITETLKKDLDSDNDWRRIYAECALKQGHTNIYVMLTESEYAVYNDLKQLLPESCVPDVSEFAHACVWKKHLQQRCVRQ